MHMSETVYVDYKKWCNAVCRHVRHAQPIALFVRRYGRRPFQVVSQFVYTEYRMTCDSNMRTLRLARRLR
jgi:hypothetical protein